MIQNQENTIPLSPVEIKRQEALQAEAQRIAAQLELDQVKPAYDTAKAKYDAAKAQLDEEWANDTTGAIAKYTIASNAVNDADKQLRAAVVSLYNEMEKETPGKAPKSHLIDGWGVAVTNEPVYETAKAVNWLIEHKHISILTVDTKKFGKLLEAIDKPQFVVMVPKVIAKINPVKK